MEFKVLFSPARKQPVSRCFGIFVMCLLMVVRASGQAVPAPKPQMSEDVFKNVQVLRGIPVDEFMGTMGFFAASLGLNCVDCHTIESLDDWAKFGDDTPRKNTARRMVLMVRALNQANFGGKSVVTCNSCHRGLSQPEAIPSLAQQYGTPPPDDPDQVQIRGKGVAGPTAEQILDRYIQALGGVQQLQKVNSFAAKGTYAGFDTDDAEVPVEFFAKAPDQLTTIVHTRLGTKTTTYDGHSAWLAAIDEPVPVMELGGGRLEGSRVDALLWFPVRIKQELKAWRSGFPEVDADGHSLQVIEGSTATGFRVKLYFDKQSGLLVRQVRYVDTVVGVNPIHIEYGDYRLVAGVKMPFHSIVTWTDGQSKIQLSQIRANAPIEAATFSKPMPASPHQSATP